MTAPKSRKGMKTRPEQIAVTAGNEYWLPVVGHPGYFVSDHGRVCSVDRVINGRFHRGVILRPGPSKSGHLTVVLGRYRTRSVHSVVLEAFRGPAPEGCEGLHKNDIPTDNRLVNLIWGTRSQNLHDAVRNGKKMTGELAPNAKLTEHAVREIRADPHRSLSSFGRKFGVTAAAIKQVRTGVTWRHVI